MFRYINMPKLVATYLREFSCNSTGEPSVLYKFIFCLCLPFVSATFRQARLNALAIAECTNSSDQIVRVLKALTGADMRIGANGGDYMASYNGDGETYENGFIYNGDSEPSVPYGDPVNLVQVEITLNDASISDVVAYLDLLVPFYVKLLITWR